MLAVFDELFAFWSVQALGDALRLAVLRLCFFVLWIVCRLPRRCGRLSSRRRRCTCFRLWSNLLRWQPCLRRRTACADKTDQRRDRDRALYIHDFTLPRNRLDDAKARAYRGSSSIDKRRRNSSLTICLPGLLLRHRRFHGFRSRLGPGLRLGFRLLLNQGSGVDLCRHRRSCALYRRRWRR